MACYGIYYLFKATEYVVVKTVSAIAGGVKKLKKSKGGEKLIDDDDADTTHGAVFQPDGGLSIATKIKSIGDRNCVVMRHVRAQQSQGKHIASM